MPLEALIPLFTSIIGAGASAGGAAIQRRQSRKDLLQQLEYNDPRNQLARIRQAGLPFAAFAGGNAGTQSTLPETTDGGLRDAGNQISSYITRNVQAKQVELLDQQIRREKTAADLDEARALWYKSQAGEDTQNTNLTRLLGIDLGTKEGLEQYETARGRIEQARAGYANEFAYNEALTRNASLAKLNEELIGAAKQNDLTDILTDKARAENGLAQLALYWTPYQNAADYANKLKQGGLIDAQTSNTQAQTAGKLIENALQTATFDAQVQQAWLNARLSGTELAQMGLHFRNETEETKFKHEIRKAFDPDEPKTMGQMWRAFQSAMYYRFAGKAQAGEIGVGPALTKIAQWRLGMKK